MRIYMAMGFILTLSACAGGGGGSIGSLNPFNLFRTGGAFSAPAELTLAPRQGYEFAIDNRPVVDQISGLTVEKTTSGAIVRATALPPAQGYYGAGLILVDPARSDEIVLEFRARPPAQVTNVGSTNLREIVAGYVLSTAELRGIRRIRVIGARNNLAVRP